MIGAKLQTLTAYFLSLGFVTPERLDSWMEDAEIILISKRQGDGMLLASVQYTARFELSAQQNPSIIAAALAVWLLNNNERPEQNPALDIDDAKDGIADVELSLVFKEELELVEDDNGPFELYGQRYRIDNTSETTATQAGVDTEPARQTDLPHNAKGAGDA